MVRVSFFGIAACLLLAAAGGAQAQTLMQALAEAYNNNPTLNQARAQVRVTDEGVPIAKSTGRPQVLGIADAGHVSSWQSAISPTVPRSSSHYNPMTIALQIQQPIFRGFRTQNAVKQAKAAVRAQRESLKNTEQEVLLNAVIAFMDVIRDSAIVSLRQSDLEFLEQQVGAARDRFEVGEGTRTDVSQAEARAASARSELNLARANVNSSRAVFQQVIGVRPKRLVPHAKIYGVMPKSQDTALTIGRAEHPAIRASEMNIDAALYNVKTIEGELLPTFTVEADVRRQWNPSGSKPDARDTASIFGRVRVPLYQGGGVSARVRQAKEELGVARIQLDVSRDQRAGQCGRLLGAVSGGNRLDHRRARRGGGQPTGLERRYRRAKGRSAYDARCARRAARIDQFPRLSRYRRAQSRGGGIFSAVLNRTP